MPVLVPPLFSFSNVTQILYDQLTQVVAKEQKEADGSIYMKINLICVREVKRLAKPQYQCSTAVFPDGSTGYDEP